MNLITKGVTNSIIGASNLISRANVAIAVYKDAKNRGDEGAMNRALGYASDSLNDAAESGKETQEELKQAQAAAVAQEKAEAKEATEKQGGQAQEMKSGKPALRNATAAEPNQESGDALQPISGTEQENGTEVLSAGNGPGTTADIKTYTSNGRAISAPAAPTISFTV